MDNQIWQTIGNFVLIWVSIAMILFFKRSASDSQKALLIGIGIFPLAITFNLIGLIEVSNYLVILGFVIITFSLIRLFWSQTSKN